MRAVLVTGASGGVGTAVVRRLKRDGWRVFAGVRSLEGPNLPAEPVILDVTDGPSIAEARKAIAAEVRDHGLQGLVNLAGVSVNGPIELVPIDGLRRQFEINVIGQVAVTQAFLPLLRTGRGRVVNMGGAAGSVTLPMYGALSASKAALAALSDALRMELKHQGLPVSHIEPGGLQTRFFERAAETTAREGYSGNLETQQIYAEALEASTKALAETHTSPVDAAVDAIVKALTQRRPPARRRVGRDAKLGTLLRLFPHGMRDRALMSSFGLRRNAFTKPEPPSPSTNPASR